VNEIEQFASCLGGPLRDWREGAAVRFEQPFPIRQAASAVDEVFCTRDLVRRHRDPAYGMRIPIHDARESVGLAVVGERTAPSTDARAFSDPHSLRVSSRARPPHPVLFPAADRAAEEKKGGEEE
jgi:hypothetical protein